MLGKLALLVPLAALGIGFGGFGCASCARIPKRHGYSPEAALGLALGGIPGVLIAAYLVQELPLDAVRWLVLAIAVVTAASLLRAAAVSSRNT